MKYCKFNQFYCQRGACLFCFSKLFPLGYLIKTNTNYKWCTTASPQLKGYHPTLPTRSIWVYIVGLLIDDVCILWKCLLFVTKFREHSSYYTSPCNLLDTNRFTNICGIGQSFYAVLGSSILSVVSRIYLGGSIMNVVRRSEFVYVFIF